jgi:electron transport complex protein RnfG
MESTLKNMVLTLGAITVVSATALGLVYGVTKEPIEASKAAKTTDALSKVIEKFDNNPAQDTTSVTIDGLPIMVYKGTLGGTPSGYAVETVTKQGFSGEIKMMVGFTTAGDISNIEVLQHAETPGLGSKIADPGNVLLVSFQGKNPADLKMQVKKDGGDIDALTASTISSRAYVDAVKRAYTAYKEVALGQVEEKPDYLAMVMPESDKKLTYVQKDIDIDGQKFTAMIGYCDTNSALADIAGYAVNSSSDKAYNGTIKLMVGFMPDGTVYNIAVTEQNETPGLGSKMADEDNPLLLSFKGKKVTDIKMEVKAKGGDVDALSGSTISSVAYIDAVNKAYKVYQELRTNIEDLESDE